MIGQLVSSTTDQVVFWLMQTGLFTLAVWFARDPHPARRARRLGAILLATGAIQLGFLALTYGQWAWRLQQEPLGQYLLPPHSTFYLRHLQTEVTALAVSWLATLLTWWTARWLFLKKLQGRMIDQLDVMLLVIGTAAVGWPGLFLFWLAVFAVSVLAMVALVIIRKKTMTDRLIVTPYILPAAWLVLLLRAWLLQVTHLSKIGF